MILQMSPASKFPKVEKEQALLKQMSEYRDEEIPGISRKEEGKKNSSVRWFEESVEFVPEFVEGERVKRLIY